MIHGAGGGGWEWEKWKPVFEKAGFDVVCPDLKPAKGGLAATKIEDYERQVISWCPKKRRVILIGASMGGALAMRVANRVHPTQMILVNAAPAQRRASKPHPAVIKWAGGPLKDTRDSMPDSDEDTIMRAWPRWRDESGKVMDSLSAGYKIVDPKCPILMMLSKKDEEIPYSNSKVFLATLLMQCSYSPILMDYDEMSHVGPLLGKRAEEVADDAAVWLRTNRNRPHPVINSMSTTSGRRG